MSNSFPIPHQDVNEILNLLLTDAKNILGGQFVGMYLYGSLSSGDFNPTSSDIDFLIVTQDILPEETISELETMHNRIWKTGLKWAAKLEGSYVHKDLIRRHDLEGTPCPTVNEGRFYVDRRGSDWIIQRHVIRETSVVLDGPDPKKLIDFVSPDDIRNAVMEILHEWWFPMLGNPSWLRDKATGDRAFAVITMCRVLHALEHGTIVSKPKAIQWARTQLTDSWIKLIDKAVAVSNHKDQDVSTEETLNFIKFIKEKTQ
jgi:predicted nucleotidyltransferase